MTIDKSSLNLDYYGIISTLADEIGITHIIDQLVNNHYNQTVTTGQSVKVVLLNMLAIFMRPLYLTSEFMNDKPVDRLIDPELSSDDFTDNVLGAALDRLFETGLEEIFMRISSQVFLRYPEFVSPYLHGDITAMAVHGEYKTKDHETAIEITHGWPNINKDGVKQFLISMVTCERLPAFLTTLSGNTTGKTQFREMILEYGSQMQEAFASPRTWIFDSEFYSKPSVKACGTDIKWITRVSERVKLAKNLVEEVEEDKFVPAKDLDDYHLHGLGMDFGGVAQRWVVVESEKAEVKEQKTLEKIICKKREKAENQLWHLSCKEFDTKDHAIKEARELQKAWKYHKVAGDLEDQATLEFTEVRHKKNGGKGAPKKGEPMITKYKPKFKVQRREEEIEKAFRKKGRFIVATNDLELDDEAILKAYKTQQNVERGFRFLKDPMFFVDAIFLKKESRIMAMAMIMGLALLIYSLAEKKLRAAFEANNELFMDRYRKQTKRPTIRRVLQTWSGIHVLYLRQNDKLLEEEVLNLRPENKQVLKLLGPQYQNIYSDNPSKFETKNRGAEIDMETSKDL